MEEQGWAAGVIAELEGEEGAEVDGGLEGGGVPGGRELRKVSDGRLGCDRRQGRARGTYGSRREECAGRGGKTAGGQRTKEGAK